MTSDAIIEVHGLVKSYDGTVAVDRLDMTVEAGRIVGLVGPNGAGKTTTLRCVAGIIPLDEGEITIGGVDLAENPIEAKRRSAFIPDTPHLFDYLTVEEHLAFIGRLYGVEDAAVRIDALLEKFELSDRRHSLPGALSRGMSQKVAIGMGFLHDPEALLLDEPLTGLDPIGIRNMKDAIVERAREQRAAVVVSSHQLELIEEICDEVVIIQRGRVVVAGPLDSIRESIGAGSDAVTLEDIFFHATGHARRDEDRTP